MISCRGKDQGEGQEVNGRHKAGTPQAPWTPSRGCHPELWVCQTVPPSVLWWVRLNTLLPCPAGCWVSHPQSSRSTTKVQVHGGPPPTWRHAVTRGNTQLHTFLHLLAGSVSSSVSEETEEPGPLSPAKNRAEERDAVRGPTKYGRPFRGLRWQSAQQSSAPPWQSPQPRLCVQA